MPPKTASAERVRTRPKEDIDLNLMEQMSWSPVNDNNGGTSKGAIAGTQGSLGKGDGTSRGLGAGKGKGSSEKGTKGEQGKGNKGDAKGKPSQPIVLPVHHLDSATAASSGGNRAQEKAKGGGASSSSSMSKAEVVKSAVDYPKFSRPTKEDGEQKTRKPTLAEIGQAERKKRKEAKETRPRKPTLAEIGQAAWKERERLQGKVAQKSTLGSSSSKENHEPCTKKSTTSTKKSSKDPGRIFSESGNKAVETKKAATGASSSSSGRKDWGDNGCSSPNWKTSDEASSNSAGEKSTEGTSSTTSMDIVGLRGEEWEKFLSEGGDDVEEFIYEMAGADNAPKTCIRMEDAEDQWAPKTRELLERLYYME